MFYPGSQLYAEHIAVECFSEQMTDIIAKLLDGQDLSVDDLDKVARIENVTEKLAREKLSFWQKISLPLALISALYGALEDEMSLLQLDINLARIRIGVEVHEYELCLMHEIFSRMAVYAEQQARMSGLYRR